MSLALLQVEGVSKSFSGLKVLNNVSLSVEEGERHAIIGPNGAGKTTLFNCMTGELGIDSGVVKMNGKVINTLSPHQLVHLGISRTFQINNLFGNLTVRENVNLAITAKKNYRFQMFKSLTSYGDVEKETDEVLKQWNMFERENIIVNNLSYGEQRLLEIILAMASKPRILLLDEPTSGMSPGESKETANLIRSFPRSVSLLMIEHDMDVVFSIADKITVLHHGEVVISGTPDNIRNSEYVRDIYFGGGAKQNART